MKHYRALQEQASTYLDLVCSVCDLSDDAVRVTAAEVQQVKLTVGIFFTSCCNIKVDIKCGYIVIIYVIVTLFCNKMDKTEFFWHVDRTSDQVQNIVAY